MVNEMTSSQKQAALQAYQRSLHSQDDDQLPFGVEAVTYDDEDDDEMDDAEVVDPTEFMEEGNLEIEEGMEEESEQVDMEVTPELAADQIEIDEGPDPEISQLETPATNEDHAEIKEATAEENIEAEEVDQPVSPESATGEDHENTEKIELQQTDEDNTETEDHIEIEQPPVTQEVIDEGGEADDEKDKNSD